MLTPLFPVLLGGLVFIGIPVLIHLIMRQKPKTLLFPAFRFLLNRHRTNLRKLRLRHLLLLALRILIIAALCLALTRPRLFYQGLSLSSERPIAAVMVFDTSPSMEYRTSNKLSRLDEAKKRGHELLDEFPPGSRVLILDTADSHPPSRSDWLMSMNTAHERIKALKPRPASVSVVQTLESAYRFLGELARNQEDDTRRYLPRFVCVFSDRTRACWDPAKLAAAHAAADQVPPFLEGLQHARGEITGLIALLKDLRTQLPPPSGRDYSEQSLIDSLEELTPLLPSLTKADMPPEAKLAALVESIHKRGRLLLEQLQPRDEKKETGDFRPRLVQSLQALLRDLRGAQGLFIDVGIDRPVDLAVTQLDLPRLAGGQVRQLFGDDEKFVLRAVVQATGKDMSSTLRCKLDKHLFQQEVSLKAGQKDTFPFEIDCQKLGLAPGYHQIEVSLATGDLLEFNNKRFVTFAIREPRRVLVVREDAAKAEKFLDALKALRFGVDAKTPREALATNSRDYQAIYLFGVAAPEPPLWKFLQNYVEQGGGGGIVPPGDELKTEAYNHAAAKEILPGNFGSKLTHGKDDGKNPGAMWNLDQESIYQHPILAPFQNWKDSDVVKYPSGAFAFWDIKPFAKDSSVLVNYRVDKENRPALLERRVGKDKDRPGKVLLFTTTLDDRKPRWNNYLETTRNSMYVVLIGLCTNYLAGATDEPNLNFICGQTDPVVALPPGARFPSYVLLGPLPNLEQISAPDNQNLVKLKQAENPGNYALDVLAGEAANKRVGAFSVNVPSEESDLTRVPAKEIESLLGAGSVTSVDPKASIREALEGHWSEPLELFPLLMIILLLVLALENLLANKFYRRDNETDESKTTAGDMLPSPPP